MSTEFVAASLGGAAGVVSGYSLDTVKVRIQTQDVSNGRLSLYKGAWDCMVKTTRNEGARSLHRGISCPLLGVAGVNAISCGVFGNVLSFLPQPDSIQSICFAGSAAGLVQSLIVAPMELLKTQIQVGGKAGITDAMRSIYSQAGLSGFSKGLGMTMLREVPALGIYFGSFEAIMRELGNSTSVILFAGGFAGILSGAATIPIDVIKTRLQADSFGGEMKYRGAFHCLQSSLKMEGCGFLFRGLGSTIIRAFPVNMATFGVYTLVMKRSNQIQKEQKLKEKRKLKKKIPSKTNIRTLATDGPNIIAYEEPVISAAAYVRMYPEQMLWAGPSSSKVLEDQEYTPALLPVYNFSSYNQFTQTCNMDPNRLNITPEVIISTNEEHLARPYWNIHSREDHERLRSCVTSQDFLLPANLLTKKKSPDRIYGFYYLVV